MDGIRRYLLTVIAAAVVCSIANTLIGKKSAASSIVRMVSGLCLAICVISPFLKIRLDHYSDYLGSFSQEADTLAADGKDAAMNELRKIIKTNSEAYILDKAASLKLDVQVEVTLSDDEPPLPCAVTINGSASPYAKRTLMHYIANDLGIPEEDQTWS